jgi:hypothetical protein
MEMRDPNDMLIPIARLRVGDMVDLEGDKYADQNRDHPTFESEYVMVASIERETPACLVVGFEGFDMVGFPPDHLLPVALASVLKPEGDE